MFEESSEREQFLRGISMTIRIDTTTEYPVRYVAFTNPRILFENPDKSLVHSPKGDKSETNGGREFAVYHSPIQNTVYSYLDDGVYAEIISFQGLSYLASVHATQPTRKREQKNDNERFPDYDTARQWLLQRIEAFELWVREGTVIA